nr:uncharacterized protein LOC107372597 isoform X3 [Nothobranchius furzeri]
MFSRTLPEHRQHVRAVLQRLLKNRLFVKAEKCEFYASSVKFLGFVLESGRLKMDPDKVVAIQTWPTPSTRKQLQRFLGFANFYRQFIRNYSQIAAPLTQLTSIKKSFLWSQEADQAFHSLKNSFTQAPILTHPDTSSQFTLEVDASDTGVGAVLSQVSPTDHCLHPCALFSRRLTPAEQNYDVGGRELMAIKLALEEWRHWLEGAEHPIVIWTDHKNLAYLKEAKRLNTRQSCWSLFFSHFNFIISFRPGSKNIKPDALSRQYASDREVEPTTILPASYIVGSISWDITNKVLEAQRHEPDPGTGPPHKIYVPSSTRGALIHWAHTARFSIHPCLGRTITLIRKTFWWPSMYKDVKEYISACQACHLVPLKSLPSSAETAELLVKHVFRLHGLPTEILSDQGLQFTSRVWTEFANHLGARVSLTSGFHPLTNGQVEHMKQELEAMLRCICSSNHAGWSSQLSWVEYAHNLHLRSPLDINLLCFPPTPLPPPQFPCFSAGPDAPGTRPGLPFTAQLIVAAGSWIVTDARCLFTPRGRWFGCPPGHQGPGRQQEVCSPLPRSFSTSQSPWSRLRPPLLASVNEGTSSISCLPTQTCDFQSSVPSC